MAKRLALFGAVAGLGVLGWTFFATAATTRSVTIAAPAFATREYSDHNKLGTSVCGTFAAHNGEGVNTGDLDNAEGSYIAAVSLPAGARVKSFSVYVNDNDGAADTHAYLIRKRMRATVNPKFAGFMEMAHAKSSGAVNNILRGFTDSTVAGATIDNSQYTYYVELVVCAITEPFGVRITYAP
jgi:hypothetical protein